MSLLRTLIVGRENGVRAKVREALVSGGKSGSASRGAGQTDAEPLVVGEQSLSLGLEAPKDVTPPEGFEVVLHKDALPVGDVVEIIIGGQAIAVANVDGQFYAFENACPHADGPLGEGGMEGCVVKCPYHGWEFDVRDGSCLTVEDQSVASYAVQIVEDAVCVAM